MPKIENNTAKIISKIIHTIAKEKLLRHANIDEHNAELLADNIANQSLEQITFELQRIAVNDAIDDTDDPDAVFEDHAGKKVKSPVFRRAPG